MPYLELFSMIKQPSLF